MSIEAPVVDGDAEIETTHDYDLSQVVVTDHAKTRWKLRCSPTAGYVVDPPPIYQAVAESVPIDSPDINPGSPARLHEDTGAVFVLDVSKPQPTVVTVVRIEGKRSVTVTAR